MALEDGTIFSITKKPREYSKNYPDAYSVAPNQSFVFNVNFSEENWKGFPKNWKNQDIKIKAIFKVKPDEQSKKLKVWNGKAESTPITVSLYK